MARPGLLLDLDGTLIDSGRDLARAVNLLLGELELPPLALDVVCSYVGNGARSLVRRCLDHVDPDHRVSREVVEMRRFLTLYEGVLLETTCVFPGVLDGLERLASRGVALAIVTNKPEAPSRVICEALGLTALVPVLLGGDSLPTRKPDPAMLRVAAERLDVPLVSCLMVGDSDVDIVAARSAGIPGVWCTWGGIHPDRPDGATHVATRFAEVESLVP